MCCCLDTMKTLVVIKTMWWTISSVRIKYFHITIIAFLIRLIYFFIFLKLFFSALCFFVDWRVGMGDSFFSQLPNKIITHSFKRPKDHLTPSNAIFVTFQKCTKKQKNYPWLKIPCRGQFDQGMEWDSIEKDFGGKIFLK